MFNEATLTTLHGDLAIGHTRYSTTGSTTWDNAQPVFKTDGAHSLALGHNGNLVNTHELARRVGTPGGATTDSDLVTTMLAAEMAVTGGLEAAAMRVLPELEGAFCFVMMDERSVYAARDPHGVRPLSHRAAPERLRAWPRRPVRSTSSARSFLRDVEPGELVRIDDRGLHLGAVRASPRARRSASSSSSTWRVPTRACAERSVHEARREMGRHLARETPVDADLVIAVPDTGHSRRAGLREVSGIPYGDGL